MTEKTHKIDEPDGGQFAALYAACERQLYGFVLSIHPYPDQVEDILQDTLAVLWKQFSSYDPDRPFFNWACGFALLKVKEHRRRESRHRHSFSEETIDALAEANELIPSDAKAREVALGFCLESLPSKDRELIESRYSGGQTLKSIADATGSTANAL